MYCKYLCVVPYKALEKFSKVLYGTTERYLQYTSFPSCHGVGMVAHACHRKKPSNDRTFFYLFILFLFFYICFFISMVNHFYFLFFLFYFFIFIF